MPVAPLLRTPSCSTDLDVLPLPHPGWVQLIKVLSDDMLCTHHHAAQQVAGAALTQAVSNQHHALHRVTQLRLTLP
jgi:hypothetical protein